MTTPPVSPTSAAPAKSQKTVILNPHRVHLDGAERVAIGPQGPHARQTQITVRKRQEVIQAIDIICACGEKITIDLEY